MNKGKLLFTTPGNDSHKLAYAYALTLLGILPWVVILMIVIFNIKDIRFSCNMGGFLGFGFVLIVSLMAFLHGDSVLNPHFKIYSNGITKPLRPLKIFFGSGEIFIPFSQIKAFETELTGKEGRTVIYYEPKKRTNYSHNKNVIGYLNKLLNKQGIIRISSNCPNCKKVTWGYYNCAYCKSNRW